MIEKNNSEVVLSDLMKGLDSIIAENISDIEDVSEEPVVSDEIKMDKGPELDTSKYDKIFDDFIYFSSYLTGKNKLKIYFDGIASGNHRAFMVTKFPNLSYIFNDFLKRNNVNPNLEDLGREKVSNLLENSVEIYSLKLVKRGMYDKRIPIFIFQDIHSGDKFVIEIDTVKKLTEMGFKFQNKLVFSKVNQTLYFAFKNNDTSLYCVGYFIPDDRG